MSVCNNKKKQNFPVSKHGELTPTLKLDDTSWKYFDRFYNQFQSKYKVTGDCINDESRNYLFRRFWADGSCALYRIEHTNTLGIAQYAATTFNIWDSPDELQLVSRRNASEHLIPIRTMINKKDAVIAKIRPDGKPIQSLARYYANKLSDIDKAIQCNLLAVRTPWIILANSENIKRVNEFMRRYLNDEIALSINPDDINSIQVLQTAANYIIDKLEVVLVAHEFPQLTVHGVGGAERHEFASCSGRHLAHTSSEAYEVPTLSRFVGEGGINHRTKLEEELVVGVARIVGTELFARARALPLVHAAACRHYFDFVVVVFGALNDGELCSG